MRKLADRGSHICELIIKFVKTNSVHSTPETVVRAHTCMAIALLDEHCYTKYLSFQIIVILNSSQKHNFQYILKLGGFLDNKELQKQINEKVLVQS